MTDPSQPSAPLGNLVAAHLQRVEIALLARILATTLAGALPASMLDVERRRSITDLLARRPATVVGVRIRTTDQTLTLRAPAVGEVEAAVEHVVRGVTLSHRPVTIAHWLEQLAATLNELAAEDESARLALERALR
jgi:hypothetical protein